LLVRVRHVGHVLHVRKLAVGGAGVASIALLRLNQPLVVDVFVPIAHRVLVLVADDKIVDNPGISFPEDLDAIEAWLLETDNIGDIRHVDSTFQLQTGLASVCKIWFILVESELRLLLVGVDIFAAKEDAFEKVDVVLVSGQ
jgi:hypothetical protein